MRRSKSNPSSTPSLFDALDTPDVSETEPDDEQDDWAEVPGPRFLSWSDAMQLSYCWRRDLDAALRAEHPTDATFYLRRAALYKADLDAR